MGNNLSLTSHLPCRVDKFLHGGERLGSLEVIHAPGHSPGHLAFYLPESRVLFTGDAVVTSPKFMGGWPGFALNARQQAETLRKLADYDAKILAVGHGEPILRNGQERLRTLL
ncbi:MAG: MBL fold metallo-hydrolase [Caldilineaceae bacterium]|nr:MBL fold metallo-hydrolase [Caldilineaceae bacterium]